MRLSSALALVGVVSAVLIGCGDDTSLGSASDDVTSEPDLFASQSVIALKLEGAFDAAFSAAHAGVPNGPLPGLPRRSIEEFPGKLTYTTGSGAPKTFDVVLKVRGNSSLAECPFPKLTMKLTDEAKAAAKNTIFAKQTKLKIGTHCADAGDGQTGTIGRLRNEKSPVREAYVYRALGTVLPTTLSTRVAKITYVDTTAKTTIERSALLLEHVDKLAKRSGAPDVCRTVDGEEECDPVLTDSELAAADPRDGMDRERIATISLFHAAVGNWDWALDVSDAPPSGQRVWNNDVILLPKEGGAPGELVKVPVAQDFDLASAVTGSLRGGDGDAPDAEKLRAQAKQFLGRTKGLTPAEIAAAKQRFVEKKAALYELVDDVTIDDAGRASARAHLDAFYAEVGE